jgi:hypothetical protein
MDPSSKTLPSSSPSAPDQSWISRWQEEPLSYHKRIELLNDLERSNSVTIAAKHQLVDYFLGSQWTGFDSTQADVALTKCFLLYVNTTKGLAPTSTDGGRLMDTQFLSGVQRACELGFRKLEGYIADALVWWTNQKRQSSPSTSPSTHSPGHSSTSGAKSNTTPDSGSQGVSLDVLAMLLAPLVELFTSRILTWFPSALDQWATILLKQFAAFPSSPKAEPLLALCLNIVCLCKMVSKQPLDEVAVLASGVATETKQRFLSGLWTVMEASPSKYAAAGAANVLRRVVWGTDESGPASPSKADQVSQLLSLCVLRDRTKTVSEELSQVKSSDALSASASSFGNVELESDFAFIEETSAAVKRVLSQGNLSNPAHYAHRRACEQLVLLLATALKDLAPLWGQSRTNQGHWRDVISSVSEESSSLDLPIEVRVSLLPYMAAESQRKVVAQLLVLLETESIASLAPLLRETFLVFLEERRLVFQQQSALFGSLPTNAHSTTEDALLKLKAQVGCELLDGIEHSISQGYPTSENLTTLLLDAVGPALGARGSLKFTPSSVLLSFLKLILRSLAATVSVDPRSWKLAIDSSLSLIATITSSEVIAPIRSAAELLVNFLPKILAMRFTLIDVTATKCIFEMMADLLKRGNSPISLSVLQSYLRVQVDAEGFLSVADEPRHQYACRFMHAKHLPLNLMLEALALHHALEGDMANTTLRALHKTLSDPFLTATSAASLVHHIPLILALTEHALFDARPMDVDGVNRYFYCVRLTASHIATPLFLSCPQVNDLWLFLLRTAESACASLNADGYPRAVMPAILAVIASVAILQHTRENQTSLLLRWTHTLRKFPPTLLEDPKIVSSTLRHLHEVFLFESFDMNDICSSGASSEADILADVVAYSLQFITPQRSPYEVFLAELVFLTWMSRAPGRSRHNVMQKILVPYLTVAQKWSKSGSVPATSSSTAPSSAVSARTPSSGGTPATPPIAFPDAYELLEVCSRFLWRTTYVGTDQFSPVDLWRTPSKLVQFSNSPARTWCLNGLVMTVAHDPAAGEGLIIVRGPSAVLCFVSRLLNPPSFNAGLLCHGSPIDNGKEVPAGIGTPEPSHPKSPLRPTPETEKSPNTVHSDHPLSESTASPVVPSPPAATTPAASPSSTTPHHGKPPTHPTTTSSVGSALKKVLQRVTSRTVMAGNMSKEDVCDGDDSPSTGGHGTPPPSGATFPAPGLSGSRTGSNPGASPPTPASSPIQEPPKPLNLQEQLEGSIASIYTAMFSPRPPTRHLVDAAALQNIPHTSSLFREISVIDRIPCIETRKVGVLYLPANLCREKARKLTDIDMMASNTPSKYFWTILRSMGDIVPLCTSKQLDGVAPWLPLDTVYTGGLPLAHDVNEQKQNYAGEYYVRYRDVFQECVFHAAPLMPTYEKEPACTRKKRHIGNDIIVIVICDSSLEAGYDAVVEGFRSEVTKIYIIVEKVSGTDLSRITIKYGKDPDQNIVHRVPSNVTKIVPDSEVGRRVSALAMHVSVLVKGSAYERGEKVMNGVERLRAIVALQEKTSLLAS